ncbi:hypothetical protein CPC08DRAFT_752453 [Agrocybe pediades]|nr:hypothetical protein CPC08DRAFT_752453 [Agrocybe pediades]
MPPCKGHKKSKNGCLMCKQRRVKCDETHPECRNCTQHGVPLKCVYAPPKSKEKSTEPPPSNVSTPLELCDICGYYHPPPVYPLSTEFPGALPGCCIIPLLSSNTPYNLTTQTMPPFGSNVLIRLSPAVPFTAIPNVSLRPEQTPYTPDTDDVSLLNHFTTSTSHTLTLCDEPESKYFWSNVIPTLCQAHPFLYHTTLTITAAHCSRTVAYAENSTIAHKFRELEKRHYKEAMNQMTRTILGGADEVNCHALFASVFIWIYYLLSRRSQLPSSQAPSILSDQPFSRGTTPQLPLDTSWVTFVRGTYGTLQGTWQWIHRGPVYQLLKERAEQYSDETIQLNANTESMLSELTKLCINFNILGSHRASEMTDPTIAAAYYSAVYRLRGIWCTIETYCSPLDIIARSQKHNALSTAIFKAVLFTPPQFWDCLEKESPRALIIYAYFIVCWETVSYGLGESVLDETTESSQMFDIPSYDASQGVSRWWIKGKAENDLAIIDALLASIARNDYERNSFKEWMGGAWRVLHGLKHGWWLKPTLDYHDAQTRELIEAFDAATAVPTIDPVDSIEYPINIIF